VVDILPTVTAGAIHTTVDTVGVTDGIAIDGVTVADGVMTDTTLLAVTVDLGTVADSKGMVVAGSRIQDMAEEAIAADPKRASSFTHNRVM
jgi:hypothetical protein